MNNSLRDTSKFSTLQRLPIYRTLSIVHQHHQLLNKPRIDRQTCIHSHCTIVLVSSTSFSLQRVCAVWESAWRRAADRSFVSQGSGDGGGEWQCGFMLDGVKSQSSSGTELRWCGKCGKRLFERVFNFVPCIISVSLFFCPPLPHFRDFSLDW